MLKDKGKIQIERGFLLLWDPGIAQRQPFSSVASSKASQSPVQVDGSVHKNELSWCGTTSPPIPGC